MKIFDMILKEEKTVIDSTMRGIKHIFTYDGGIVVERYSNDYEVIDNSKYEVREYYGINKEGKLLYETIRVKPSFGKAYEKLKYLIDCVDDTVINPYIPEKFRDEYIRKTLEKGKNVLTIISLPNTKPIENISNETRFKRNKIEHINWNKLSEYDIDRVYETIKDYI